MQAVFRGFETQQKVKHQDEDLTDLIRKCFWKVHVHFPPEKSGRIQRWLLVLVHQDLGQRLQRPRSVCLAVQGAEAASRILHLLRNRPQRAVQNPTQGLTPIKHFSCNWMLLGRYCKKIHAATERVLQVCLFCQGVTSTAAWNYNSIKVLYRTREHSP